MMQLVRGRNRRIGYFLRGATAFAPERTLTALMRFMMGLLFTTYERTVTGIRCADEVAPTVDAPAKSAPTGGLPLASRENSKEQMRFPSDVRSAREASRPAALVGPLVARGQVGRESVRGLPILLSRKPWEQQLLKRRGALPQHGA